jgi:hypothetical protein
MRRARPGVQLCFMLMTGLISMPHAKDCMPVRPWADMPVLH